MMDDFDRISPPSVYVVDSDESVCDSLKELLTSAGFLVGCFASGRDFLKTASSLPSGCLVSEVRLPEFDGVELLHRLMARGLNFPAIMITRHGAIDVAVRAMRAGAVDFIEKPVPKEPLLEGISRAQQHLNSLRNHDMRVRVARERLALLTERERDVLDGLVAGLPNKTIAYDLNIGPRTVELHRARVMSKMHVRSFAELVRVALAAGCDPDRPITSR